MRKHSKNPWTQNELVTENGSAIQRLGSSPPSNHIFLKFLQILSCISYIKPDVNKTLKSNFSGYQMTL